MTARLLRRLHVGLAVAPHEVQATASGVRLAHSFIQRISPGAYELSLSVHDNPADLLALSSLDYGLLSTAGEPLDAKVEDIVRIWDKRVADFVNRNAVVLMLNQFRCVNRQRPDHRERLLRIRELNRAQITLAQKNDFILVNLDCVLADLGGNFLECDHRLRSTGGQMAAGHTVAHALLKSGFRDKIDALSLDGALKILGGIDNLRTAIDQLSEPHGA